MHTIFYPSLSSLISGLISTYQNPPSEKIYKKAFLSYSHLNFEKVSLFNEGLINGEYRTFFDAESLQSGEYWPDKIRQSIEDSDKFFLFWTTEARNSEQVEKEARYAQKQSERTGNPIIVPIALETPIPKPPDYLANLHFNSPHQLIRAGYGKREFE